MAHTLDHIPSSGFLTRFFEALVSLGENSPRGRVTQELASMSDAEIQALGTTREALVMKTLASGHV